MYDVVTIGTATRDVFLESPLFKVVRDPVHLQKIGFPTGEAQCFALGGKIEVHRPTITVGGGAANAAVTFARQGLKTAAVVSIGKDEEGASVIRALEEEKIQVIASRDKKHMTAYSVILLSGGERTILNYRGASLNLSEAALNGMKLSARAAYIVPGSIPFPVIAHTVERFARQGAFVAMNPSKHYLMLGTKKLHALFKHLDLVMMNREEASFLTGVAYQDVATMFTRLDRMIGGIAVMTDGGKGVLVGEKGKIYKAGTFHEKKLVDRTGAGDAFGSGFVAGMLQAKKKKMKHEEAIRYAIRLASANATSVVEAIGAEPGILTTRQFSEGARWKKLPISIQ